MEVVVVVVVTLVVLWPLPRDGTSSKHLGGQRTNPMVLVLSLPPCPFQGTEFPESINDSISFVQREIAPSLVGAWDLQKIELPVDTGTGEFTRPCQRCLLRASVHFVKSQNSLVAVQS